MYFDNFAPRCLPRFGQGWSLSILLIHALHLNLRHCTTTTKAGTWNNFSPLLGTEHSYYVWLFHTKKLYKLSTPKLSFQENKGCLPIKQEKWRNQPCVTLLLSHVQKLDRFSEYRFWPLCSTDGLWSEPFQGLKTCLAYQSARGCDRVLCK